MMLALAHAVQTVDEVELVLIEGRGTHGFCAGADIVEFLKGEDNLERHSESAYCSKEQRTLANPMAISIACADVVSIR
jgi:enoyl-CoA hydratase/carnithine racemase